MNGIQVSWNSRNRGKTVCKEENKEFLHDSAFSYFYRIFNPVLNEFAEEYCVLENDKFEVPKNRPASLCKWGIMDRVLRVFEASEYINTFFKAHLLTTCGQKPRILHVTKPGLFGKAAAFIADYECKLLFFESEPSATDLEDYFSFNDSSPQDSSKYVKLLNRAKWLFANADGDYWECFSGTKENQDKIREAINRCAHYQVKDISISESLFF